MHLPKFEQRNETSRFGRFLRALVAMVLTATAIALLPAALASAAGSRIGVFVDNPPETTTTLAPIAPAPTTGTTVTTVPTPVTAPLSAQEQTQATLPDVLPPQETVQEEAPKNAISRAAAGTKKVISDVLSGKPVAEALQAVLPQSAAEIVVPAVRTASTFAFPIGLAGAVLAFLGLQQRIDAGDPKLTAAPLAHDDDEVEFL